MSSVPDPSGPYVLIAVSLPVLLGSLFFLPTRYGATTQPARQFLSECLRMYALGFGLPVAICIAAVHRWIAWSIAIGVTIVSMGWFAVLLYRVVSRQGEKAEQMKCRGCKKDLRRQGLGGGEMRFCGECGIEEPSRGVVVEEEEERLVKQ